MTRSIQIQLGTEHGDWFRAALEKLASDVLIDSEAGQRGRKVSAMVQMVAMAYIRNATKTARLMRQIKSVVMTPPNNAI